MKSGELEIAFRAFTVRKQQKASSQSISKIAVEPWPPTVLIIDAETTTDSAQSLTFGSARVSEWKPDHSLKCKREYLIYADNLAQRDPEGFAVLNDYLRNHVSDRLKLISRLDFVKTVLWRACQAWVLIAGFNLPFDLSRLSIGWSRARGKRFRGGFSLKFWNLEGETENQAENRFPPRIRFKHIDSKRSLIGLARVGKGAPFPGQFLDTKTLTFALSNQAHSLESACEAFGVLHGKQKTREHGKITPEYIDYNRNDVRATAELFEKLRAEFDCHPIDLLPSKTLSPASIAKWYLKRMGVRAPREQFADVPIDLHAAAMLSFYGGRSECHIRALPVPVVYCDFLSMYPTVNTLMGFWWLLTAEEIIAEDATEEVQQLLNGLKPGDCFNPQTWKQFTFYAQILPSEDILPVRARYERAKSAFNIGVNYVTSRIPIWYCGPDLVASKMLTGRAPKVVRAIRLVGKGRQSGLRSVKLRGTVEVDPMRDDFFRCIVEQRKNLKNRIGLSAEERSRLDKFLKVEANAGTYGIFVELNPEELPKKETAKLTVYGLNGPFPAESKKPEEPGQFSFPPLAALTTGAARLMLALLEREVTEAGGTYAFCDTDSMAIVAKRGDGLLEKNVSQDRINALSWGEVERIVEKFSSLNPYDRSIIPNSILRIEDANFDKRKEQREIHAYAISAKRYALFVNKPNGDIQILDDPSEHGLGHLRNPLDPDDESRGWIKEIWHYLVTKALGHNPEPPSWLGRPAISRITASTPDIVERLNQARKRLPYEDQAKPMNFGLACHVVQSALPQGVDPEHFQLLAPFESDPRKWPGLTWIDRHSGKKYGITTKLSTQPDIVLVKSYADVLIEYESYPESKSAGAKGVSPRQARGVLMRRHITIAPEKICYIGKESNQLENMESELEHCLEDVLEIYKDPKTGLLDATIYAELKKIPGRELARLTGASMRSIRAIRNGHQRPSTKLLRAILNTLKNRTA